MNRTGFALLVSFMAVGAVGWLMTADGQIRDVERMPKPESAAGWWQPIVLVPTRVDALRQEYPETMEVIDALEDPLGNWWLDIYAGRTLGILRRALPNEPSSLRRARYGLTGAFWALKSLTEFGRPSDCWLHMGAEALPGALLAKDPLQPWDDFGDGVRDCARSMCIVLGNDDEEAGG